MINWKTVFFVLGALLTGLGIVLLIPWIFSLFQAGLHGRSLGITFLFSMSAGILTMWFCRSNRGPVGKREGYLIVAGSWVLIALMSSLPYLLSGQLPQLSSAVFESVSGLTTTGATVFNDPESVPASLLLWRSLTQWIGGMGIIVLTVAVFPLLGIGGVELFVAESPGPTYDKIHPRIAGVAKRLWLIYIGLTLVLFNLLWLGGMSPFDAVNHALTTMATGGFSTHAESVGYFQSAYLEYVLILFMILAGTNYTVLYWHLSGRVKKAWKSDEFRFYLMIIVVAPLVASFILYVSHSSMNWEELYRSALFQIVSVITTTGYITRDFTEWGDHFTFFFFLLLFVGACAGSTSGGIKLIRHLVFFKNSILEFKRLIHPRAMIRIKVDGSVVAPRVLTHILVFLLLYMILFVTGSLIMVWNLQDFDRPFLSAIGAVATALGNVGPAVGDLGPTDTFSSVPASGKWVLCVLMLLGRLELFTILILFTPYFWRTN